MLNMPNNLKIIIAAGFFSPALALGSIRSGSLVDGASPNTPYGDAAHLGELLIAVLATLPILTSSLLMARRINKGRYLFAGGWVFLCLSPLALSAVRATLDIFLMQFAFNLVVGGALTCYLFCNKRIRAYFLAERSNA